VTQSIGATAFSKVGGGRELLILRHGKSSWPSGVSDMDRPLKKRGERNATQIGAWLASRNLVPTCCYSSPALRARDTARRVCDAMGVEECRRAVEPQLYHSGSATLLQLVRSFSSDDHRVMIVGHNPGLEQFSLDMAAPQSPVSGESDYMATATLVVMQWGGEWRDAALGAASILHWIYPRDLP
jgi:phosphohistidine phosphatase